MLFENNRVRLSIFVIMTVLGCIVCHAQTHMRIHQKGNAPLDIPLTQVDSITFVEKDSEVENAGLTGSWLWGSTEAGYYELLTFNDDHSYTGYDNYFAYGFDTMTYGWYGQVGTMLTLQSNGYGYQRRYNWFIMTLSENALEVMTKMGAFTYYRLKPEIITLKAGGEPLTCADGDAFVFADGVTVKVMDGKLYGLTKGVTYILQHIAASDIIVAFQVMVE